MADAVVHVKVADLEPFKRFIAKVAEAYMHFYGMSVEDAKALPDSAVRGYMTLDAALTGLGVDFPGGGEREQAVRAQTEALRDLGAQTAAQMRREQEMRPQRRQG
jgi:hypothetical protein